MKGRGSIAAGEQEEGGMVVVRGWQRSGEFALPTARAVCHQWIDSGPVMGVTLPMNTDMNTQVAHGRMTTDHC